MLRFFVTCVIRYAAHTQSRFGHPCNILSPPDILILHFLSSFSFTLLIVTCRILSLIPYSLMMGFALFVFVRHTAHCFLLLVNYLSCGWPCSGLFCLYMANEIEAWCNHTKNDRFKVSLPIDYFFERSVEQHYQNLHKLCTYQVRGGGARSGQSTPEVFRQAFSENQFFQSAAKTFWHFDMVPSALVWQISHWREADSNRERSVIACQVPETLLFSTFRWDGMSWVFTTELVMFCLYGKCFLVVVMQHRGILKNTRAAAFSKVLLAQVCARVFILENSRVSVMVKCLVVTKTSCLMLTTCLWLSCLKKTYTCKGKAQWWYWLENTGAAQNVTADNWFTSYLLAKSLRENYGLTYVGNCSYKETRILRVMLDKGNYTLGQSAFAFSMDMTLVAFATATSKTNKKLVCLLSFTHNHPVVCENNKPEIIM